MRAAGRSVGGGREVGSGRSVRQRKVVSKDVAVEPGKREKLLLVLVGVSTAREWWEEGKVRTHRGRHFLSGVHNSSRLALSGGHSRIGLMREFVTREHLKGRR